MNVKIRRLQIERGRKRGRYLRLLFPQGVENEGLGGGDERKIGKKEGT